MNTGVEIFSLATVGFGLMLSSRFISSSRRHRTELWLGLYVLLLVGCVAEIFVEENMAALSIIGCTYWLIGPLLYFYVRAKVLQQFFSWKTDYRFFLPFGVYLVLLTIPAEISKSSVELIDLIFYEFLFLHIFLHFFWCVQIILKWKLSSHAGFNAKLDRAFSLVIVFLSAGIFVTSWVSTHLLVFTGTQMSQEFKIFIQAALTFLIFCIALLRPERTQGVLA